MATYRPIADQRDALLLDAVAGVNLGASISETRRTQDPLDRGTEAVDCRTI